MGLEGIDLGVITTAQRYKYYILVLGGRWHDLPSDWVAGNFRQLGQDIGPSAVIARGYTDHFDVEAVGKYWNEIEEIKARPRFFAKRRIKKEYREMLDRFSRPANAVPEPLLIVSERNPHHPAAAGEMFFLIPLLPFTSDAELSRLFRTISGCCKVNNFAALEALLAEKFGEGETGFVASANNMFELKPNIAGVGLNINGLIEFLDATLKNKRFKRSLR